MDHYAFASSREKEREIVSEWQINQAGDKRQRERETGKEGERKRDIIKEGETQK